MAGAIGVEEILGQDFGGQAAFERLGGLGSDVGEFVQLSKVDDVLEGGNGVGGEFPDLGGVVGNLPCEVEGGFVVSRDVWMDSGEKAKGSIGIACGEVAGEAKRDLPLEGVEADGEPGIGEGAGLVGGEGDLEPGLFEAEFPVKRIEAEAARELGFNASGVGRVFCLQPDQPNLAIDRKGPEREGTFDTLASALPVLMPGGELQSGDD